MKWNYYMKRLNKKVALAMLLVLLGSMFLPMPVKAQGGLAISGSFYRQVFEIPQGSSVSGPSIYITVFNQGDEEVGIRMSWNAPPGVNILLSEDDFKLQPGAQQKVLIGIEVSPDAAPGEYEAVVTAESYKDDAEGIQIMGAATQSATLVVLGESASVKVQAKSPDGNPVRAVVRLLKVIGEQNHEFGYSEDGVLEAKVSPGKYIASAYVAGQKLAQETFEMEPDEEKVVTLTVATVYFEGFRIVPSYVTETGELAFAEVVYTVNNLYQSFSKGEVILEVNLDGSSLGEITLATLTPLEKGRLGLKYSYTPVAGWEDGDYGFRLRLEIDGEAYATTTEETLQRGSSSTSHNFPWAILGGGAAGGIVLIIIVILVLRKRFS